MDHGDNIYEVRYDFNKIVGYNVVDRDHIKNEWSGISGIIIKWLIRDGVAALEAHSIRFIEPRNIKAATNYRLDNLEEFMLNEKLGKLIEKI